MALNQKQCVEEFIDWWRGRGDEKQETQLFWLDLMQNVLGLQHAIESTKFEYKTAGNGFIDVLCPDARFLVEQKSSDIDLDMSEPRQGTMVTPVQQAVRYSDNLPLSLTPSKMCVCNFQRFRLYDLEVDSRVKVESAARISRTWTTAASPRSTCWSTSLRACWPTTRTRTARTSGAAT